jgi:5-methylcytosine-specific restriction endonuclease McrA
LPLGRICPGCKNIVVGVCPNGCRPGGKRLTPRRVRNQKVWGSAAHKRQRRRVLEREDFTCQRCGHRDQTGRGLVADHVLGIDESDPFRTYADDELQTLCSVCSGKKDGQQPRP